MPHTFDHVPLRQVEVSVLVEPDLDLSLDTLSSIRAAVREDLPDSRLLVAPMALGQQTAHFVVGAQPALLLGNKATGAALQVFANAIQAVWMSTDASREYVRYETLKRIVVAAARSCGGQAKSVRIGYRSLIPLEEGENSWDWMNDRWFTDAVKGDILTFEVVSAYRLPSGVDFRVGSTNTPEGMLASTDAGCPIEGGEIDSTLDRVHRAINEEFANIVTDKYKAKWGYR